MRLYCTIFTEECNFGFGLPRSDTCARCDALSIAIKSTSGDDLGRLGREQAEHHMHTDAGYSNKLWDKKATVQSWSRKSPVIGGEVPYRRINVVDMITFDFQQNLPMPNLHHSDIFFTRQLWTYNFGIHDCMANQGYLFMWNETTTKCGSSEMASCIHKFLKHFRTGAR